MLEMTITLGENKKVDAVGSRFTIHTDQPKDEGGDGTAPEPFALFLASIGTCAGFYIQSFCRSRNIPTDNIRIAQKSEWNKEQKRVTDVTLSIHVPPDFPEKYKSALIRAADQCTVKRNIFAPPEFHLETVVG